MGSSSSTLLIERRIAHVDPVLIVLVVAGTLFFVPMLFAENARGSAALIVLIGAVVAILMVVA
jgi:hypothetical protein